MIELVDIGANLAHRSFHADLDAVVARARDAGVRQLVVTGTSLRASEEAAALARSRPGVLFATAGVHPHDARSWTSEVEAAIRALLARPEVVAAGECGLDFDRNFSTPADQERAFAAQLTLAREAGKPLFLHERAAHARFVALAQEARIAAGVVHCFTGGPDEARAYLDLGLHLGITGWLCDERRGGALREAARTIPLDRLLLETDAPFLAPRDLRPQPPKGRNEPYVLPHVLARLAQLRGEAPEAVAAATTANARRLFGLPEAA